MRRIALALAAFAAVAGVAASAEPEEPRGSDFIDTLNGSSFAFPSTGAWKVEDAGKVEVLRTDREPNRSATQPLDRQGLSVVWAQECEPDRQQVHFRRRVYLAGPEWLLGAAIDLVNGPGARIKSARMLVNGTEVLEVRGHGGGFDQKDRNRNAFRFGSNVIEVIAVKAPNDRPRRCNRSSDPNKVTGVRWNVHGEFAGDVALPPQQAEEYRRLPEDSFGAGVPLDFEVRNNGPGGLALLRLNVQITVPSTGEPHGHLLQISEPQPPVQSCTATPPAGQVTDGQRFVTCTIANVRSGTTARQNMRVTFFVPPNAQRAPVYLRWSAFPDDEPPGSNGTDNERIKTIWVCQHQDLGCGAP